MSFLDDIPGTIADALGGDFRDAVLTRAGAPTGPTYDPTPGVPTTYTCKAIHDTWSAYYRASGLVQASDQRVLVLATTLKASDGTLVTPQLGDTIALEGTTLRVVSDGGGQPGVSTDPAGAVWVLRCRI